MLQTPDAVADDGLFDLTVIRRMNPLQVLYNFKVLFNGRIYRLHSTSLNRGRTIRIESSPEIAIEVDGEALGESPLEFEVIDRAVRVVVSESSCARRQHDSLHKQTRINARINTGGKNSNRCYLHNRRHWKLP